MPCCDALGEIFRRAELAYQDPVVDTLGTDTSSVLMDALLAVPGDPYAVAPAPAAGAAAPAEVLTGAFPALPDLDDEVPVEVAPPLVVPEPEPEPVAEVAEAELELVPAAEPELAEVADPEAPELDAEPLDAADADLGLTMEWDNELAPLEPEEEPHHAEPEPGSVLTGGTKVRRSAPRPLVILLPLLLVVAIAAGAAAVAGVFSGDSSTPAISKPPAPHVQAPVTTPLPIRIRHRPAASTATPSSTAATGTSTTASGAAGSTASGTTASTTVP